MRYRKMVEGVFLARPNRFIAHIEIDGNFMRTVQKKEDGYSLIVRTYGMEEVSSDCNYEIHISNDYLVTFFALDP